MSQRTSFTIIMAAQDEGEALARNLPQILTQEYDGDYSVVVIDESSTDNTADVLDALKAENQRLYTTFVPKYHFQRNPRRLALSLGVKAAKSDWIVVVEPTTPITSAQWLQELAPFAQEPTVLMTGYINRKSGDVRLRTFDELSPAKGIINKTERWRSTKGGRWKTRLIPGTGYDFIAVRHSLGHELLKFFEIP